MQHFLQTISSISNVFLFPLLLPRFKGSHQQLPKYIKSFQRTYDKEKFQFLYLISYLQFDIIHLISAVNCFPSKFIILIATKNYMNFIFYFFFLTIFANFHIFLKIIPLSSVYCEVMRRQPYFSYIVPIVVVMQIQMSFLFKEFFCL